MLFLLLRSRACPASTLLAWGVMAGGMTAGMTELPKARRK
jgi:hypothetical protein